MAFFPRTIYNTEASIAPLFRLFEEIDNQSRQSKCQSQGRCAPRRAPAPAPAPRWQPRFDVRETAGAYHLYGELPGLSKEDISIEFPEHQQIVIRGKTERNYLSTTAPVAPTPAVAAKEPESEPVAETISDDSSSRHSHQATVEDDSEDDDNFEVIEGEKPQQPENEADEDESMTEREKEEQPEPQARSEPTPAATEKLRFWLKERSIGQFARGFSFPERIEQDDVTASLKDGVLTVTVPKSKPHEPRHITVY